MDIYDWYAFKAAVFVGTYLAIVIPALSTAPLWMNVLAIIGGWSITYLSVAEFTARATESL